MYVLWGLFLVQIVLHFRADRRIIGETLFLVQALDLSVYIILCDLGTRGAGATTPIRLGIIIGPLKVSEISHAREEVITAPEMIITTRNNSSPGRINFVLLPERLARVRFAPSAPN